MAEYRNDDLDLGDQEVPPHSVVNPTVGRAVRRLFLGTLVLLFVLVAIALLYWATRPPQDVGGRGEPEAVGTAGRKAAGRDAEGERGSTPDTPGGHDPDVIPATPEAEIVQRTGRPITRLRGVLAEDSRNVIGNRVELRGVEVERVESPTLFWIRDGDDRVAVLASGAVPPVQAGQSVNVTGAVERVGSTVRIRASRVEAAE